MSMSRRPSLLAPVLGLAVRVGVATPPLALAPNFESRVVSRAVSHLVFGVVQNTTPQASEPQ
jgi:hypothetical protein